MVEKRGNPTLDQVRNKDLKAANDRRATLADAHVLAIGQALLRASEEGVGMPYDRYADWLNAHGYRTRRGNAWTGRTVSRIFKWLSAANERSLAGKDDRETILRARDHSTGHGEP